MGWKRLLIDIVEVALISYIDIRDE